MTADTSWYGQQTLVHPDYNHQPYAPYETYADPYVGYTGHQQDHHQQYGYAQYGYAQQGYAQPYGYDGTPGGYGDPTPYQAPVPSGYGWPDYYPEQHEATLVAEYAGYPGQVDSGAYPDHRAYQDHDAQDGYAAYPDHVDFSCYDTLTDVSFATATGNEIDPVPSDEAAGDTADAGAGGPDAVGRNAVGLAGDGLASGETCAAQRGSRRRGARRRSAVLTIAVPSVAVLGVAGAAAATIGPLRAHHHDTTASASAVQASAQAKAQALAAAEARDAAERAARDKARTALQLREAAARKAAAEAPRYVLPIDYHTGLSALFGQAGTHWMQLHTGIDFPVPVGTPVHAVTGGTVTTEWNPFYGYMVKLTAPDGTVTWYCHLSSYRVRSGQVKVGDIIAYSGDTGNSTGPHLHFEVHPDGGPAVDPLPWLLARGLDPR